MNKIDKLRKKIEFSKTIENKNISKVIKWYRSRIKLDRTKVKKVPLSELKIGIFQKMEIFTIKVNSFFLWKVLKL